MYCSSYRGGRDGSGGRWDGPPPQRNNRWDNSPVENRRWDSQNNDGGRWGNNRWNNDNKGGWDNNKEGGRWNNLRDETPADWSKIQPANERVEK